jgi:hypothetical protein
MSFWQWVVLIGLCWAGLCLLIMVVAAAVGYLRRKE